jgi:peptidoglycan/LPS O-acetylase OafA/YrhL
MLSWLRQPQVSHGEHGEHSISLLAPDETSIEKAFELSTFNDRCRSFLQLLPSLKGRDKQPRKLHASSYLDGLRGTAALIVFFHHGTQAFLPSLRPGFLSSPNATNLLSLPIIRIIYSGGPMVSIFFVISGYVLSIKPLQLSYKDDLPAAHANVASATFRRGIRLFLPCLVSTFLTAVLAMFGAFVQGQNIGLQRGYLRLDTWAEQMGRWWEQSLWFINPFAGRHEFEENTWTIPAEYKGSLLVFLTTAGLAGRSKLMRRACICAGFAYWFWYGYWDYMQFLAGIGIADLRASRPDDGKRTRNVRNIHTLLILVAVYLLSMPEYDEGGANTPGYMTLANYLTPEWWKSHWGPGRWWPTIGAIMLIATLDQVGPDSVFQQVFTSNFAQFLGDISFSLYLLHGITLYSVGVRVVNMCTSILGGEEPFWYVVSLILSLGIVLPFLFWISRLFTDAVDQGAVNLAKRMAQW